MGLFTTTTKAPARKNIFISYRVSDTSGETGRLVDSLKQYFFEDQIFIDIDKIEPGVDFTEAIAKSLESCDVMLAIIGPNWQGLNTTNNTSRINNANDWVRLEIGTALKRNIRVVPVLVDGADLPAEDMLPEDLKPLLRRQAYEISNKRWKYDTEQLIRFLVKSVGIAPKQQETAVPVREQQSWWSKNYPWVIIVGAIIIAIGIFFPTDDDATNYDRGSVLPIKHDEGSSAEKEIKNEPIKNELEEQSVAGIWYDSNGLYYLDILQKGNELSSTSYSVAGLQTGQGSGSFQNGQLMLVMNVANFGQLTIQANLSDDGGHLNGTTKIENNGTALSEPLHLYKSK